VTGAATGATDTLNGVNVHTIAIQVPKASVKGPNDSVIGVWATSKRPTMTVLNGNGTKQTGGNGHFWTQVSRLGNPLVNEVVVPLAGKDLFNATTPADDKQFLGGVTLSPPGEIPKRVFQGQRPGDESHRPGGGLPDRHQGAEHAGQRKPGAR